jgi:hypothetical protein
MKTTEREREAVELLVHYMEQAGVNITSDTHSELEKLVRLIVEAAVDDVLATPAIKRKMLLLHHFETGKEIWQDADLIVTAELVATQPPNPPFRTEEIPEHTRLTVRTGNGPHHIGTYLLVKQHPGEIAGSGHWELAQAGLPVTAGR